MGKLSTFDGRGLKDSMIGRYCIALTDVSAMMLDNETHNKQSLLLRHCLFLNTFITQSDQDVKNI